MIYLSEALVSEKLGIEDIIVEDAQGRPLKKLTIEGEFSRAGVKNKNNRIYSEALLRRETDKLKREISERGGIGSELDHPLPGESREAMALAQRISTERVCGLITHLEMNNSIIYGKMTVLEDGGNAGKQLAAMIRAGWKPGISSRGLGGNPVINSEGIQEIPLDYNQISYDIVSNPSSYNAILKAQINEECEKFMSLQKQPGKKLFQVMIDLKNKHIGPL